MNSSLYPKLNLLAITTRWIHSTMGYPRTHLELNIVVGSDFGV
jgi:hypothetical protein